MRALFPKDSEKLVSTYISRLCRLACQVVAWAIFSAGPRLSALTIMKAGDGIQSAGQVLGLTRFLYRR